MKQEKEKKIFSKAKSEIAGRQDALSRRGMTNIEHGGSITRQSNSQSLV